MAASLGRDHDAINPAPRLRAHMGAFGALLITLSCLSPGIGVFIVGADTLHEAGTSVVLAFAAAALLGLAMAQVYAELASAFPGPGGEYTVLGSVLGPVWGVAVLSLNLFGFAAAQSLSGLGAASYLAGVAPGLPAPATAAALVIVVTAAAVLDVRVAAWITGIFLGVEMLSLFIVAALGFAHPHRGLAQAVLHPMMHAAHGAGLVSTPLIVAGAATAGAVYAFNGYGSAIFLGEELRDAGRRIAGVIFLALGVAVVSQLAPLIGISVGAPDLARLTGSKAPITDFVAGAAGAGAARLIGLGVALAIFNAMIAVALMAGRNLYATGRDRMWPAPISDALRRIHPRLGSPWIATIAMGAAALVGCGLEPRVLVVILGSGNLAIYAGLCVAVIVRRTRSDRTADGYRMPLFPLAPVLAIVALTAILVLALLDPAARAGVIATLATIAAAAAYHRLVLRRNSAWTLRGPGTAAEPRPPSGDE